MASVSIQEKTSGVKPTVSHRFFISASGAWLFIGIRADIIHRHLGGKVALFVICHVARLTELLAPGGRLTVAHSMGLESLHRHHAGAARHVSRPMLLPQQLAALMAPALTVDVAVSDREKYVVSGYLAERSPHGGD